MWPSSTISALTMMLMLSLMWIGVVASDLKIAVGLEVPSRFVGQVLARLATGVGAGVIVAHRI